MVIAFNYLNLMKIFLETPWIKTRIVEIIVGEFDMQELSDALFSFWKGQDYTRSWQEQSSDFFINQNETFPQILNWKKSHCSLTELYTPY